ncbi:MAG: hypothetical protein HZB53_10250 [Chloroflexi bacterium]|nr:hypothetical protein [Chloroflexota bacterium]
MSNIKTLTCPSCGAKLEISGNDAQVTCSYCGNAVIVPEELRNKPDKPVEIVRPQVVIVQTPVVTQAPVVTITRSGGSGCVGCLLPLIMLVIIGGVLVASGQLKSSLLDEYLPPALRTAIPQMPGVIQSAASGGFARRVSSFGAEGTAPGFFHDARHIAVDGAGNIYVSDYNTLRIQRFDKDGKFLNFWTIEEKGTFKFGPTRLAADLDGNVYAIWSQMLLKYEGSTGKLLKKFTGDSISKSAAIPEEIADVAVLANGQVLTLNGLGFGDDLVRYDKDGKVLSRTSKIVSTPKGDSVFLSSLHMAADGLGNLFIVDTFPSQPAIYKFGPDGKYLNRFGGKGDKPGQFTSLGDSLTVDAKSRVYVRDISKILVFDSDGRYIDSIPNSLYNFALQDMTSYNNELYVVGQNTVTKLAVSDGK